MSNVEGTIFDLRRFSLHDGPGIRTTIFMKGCPLSCWWCHNPESQSFQPEIMLWEQRCIGCGECVDHCRQGAIVKVEREDGSFRILTNLNRCTRCGECIEVCVSDARERIGRKVTVGRLIREIERDWPFFEESGGGVTFSGGEPLSQLNFLAEALKACKHHDLHTAVDTSGYAPWNAFEVILPYTDIFLYDVKLMEDSLHRRYTGVPNGLILQNLRSLSSHGASIILRLPIIPGINDGEENLRPFCEFAISLPQIPRVDILPFHHSATGKYDRMQREYAITGFLVPTNERMKEIADHLRQYKLDVKIGG